MTSTLRRKLAERTAQKVTQNLQDAQAYTCTVPTYGLFGDALLTDAKSNDRVLKFQNRVNRAIELPGARVTVTKTRRKLNIYATKR